MQLKKNNCELASALLKSGANINAKDDQTGKTALGEAINSGNLEIIEFLLKNGANSKITGWMNYENETQANFSEHPDKAQDIIDLLNIYE